MKKLIAMVALVASAAFADVTVYNPIQEDFTVVHSAPSGQLDKYSLGRGVSHMGYRGFFPGGATAKTEIQDSLGTVVASGVLKDPLGYLLLPGPQGYRLVEGGTGSRDKTVPAVCILNTLEGEYTIDFFGTSGKAGQSNVKAGRSFDRAGWVKMPAGEDGFKFAIHGPEGVLTAEDVVQQGTYLVLHKNSSGAVTLSECGYLRAGK